MLQVLLWALLVLTLPRQTCGFNSKGSNEDTGEKLKSNGGTTLFDLSKYSVCQPRETFVKVHEEFPNEMQYPIKPSCVPVQRCLGCCSDEETTCTPQKNTTVMLEVFRIYPKKTPEKIMLPFVKHTRCACRYRKKD